MDQKLGVILHNIEQEEKNWGPVPEYSASRKARFHTKWKIWIPCCVVELAIAVIALNWYIGLRLEQSTDVFKYMIACSLFIMAFFSYTSTVATVIISWWMNDAEYNIRKMMSSIGEWRNITGERFVSVLKVIREAIQEHSVLGLAKRVERLEEFEDIEKT